MANERSLYTESNLFIRGSVWGIVIIIVQNELSKVGSNPKQGCFHFCLCWERHESIFSSLQLYVNSRVD